MKKLRENKGRQKKGCKGRENKMLLKLLLNKNVKKLNRLNYWLKKKNKIELMPKKHLRMQDKQKPRNLE